MTGSEADHRRLHISYPIFGLKSIVGSGREFEGDIQWSKILDLVKFAAPCLDLVRMKNSNFDWHLESAMKKLTIEEKVWSLGQVADRLERELLRKPNAIHLGANNVVRQEALEVKPRKPLLPILTHPLDICKDSIPQRVGLCVWA